MKLWTLIIGWIGMLLTSFAFAEPLDDVVAVVNDNVITATELDKQLKELKQQLTSQNVNLPDDTTLKKQVLSRLIDTELQLQIAKRQNLQVDDKALNAALERVAAQNHLTLDKLKEAVEHQGFTWSAYKERMRREVLLVQLQQRAVGGEVEVNPKQVELFLKQSRAQKRAQYALYHVQNLLIPLPEDASPAQEKAALQKATQLMQALKKGQSMQRLASEANQGEFALEQGDLGERHLSELPALFASPLMQMQKGEVSEPIRAGNGYQLIQLLNVTLPSEKHLVNKTHVRHILVKDGVGLTKTEAKQQRQHLYQQLKSNQDFARLAKQYSLDALSAAKGGDLGWVSPGDLVPEFEKVMDTLPLNVVSKPVKSRFGWHFIQVLERKKEDDTAAYERNQVQQALHQRKFNEVVQNWQQRLRGQAYVQILDKALA